MTDIAGYGLDDYVLDAVHEDGELVLYRGRRRTGAGPYPPAVLVLMPASPYPAPETLRNMENEYSLAGELDAAWAAPPVALAAHRGGTVLLLQDPGGEPLDRLLERQRTSGAPMPLELFLRLAVGLAIALGELHRRGIVHKDVTPAHVLVDAATGRVWLTGFGIASRLPRERQAPEPPEFVAGTLPYMAPEQTGWMNRSIDARSDLYALGVTLYEMLTGGLPFAVADPADPMEWVHCHIARRPVPPAERARDVPAAVSAIVLKLLAKTPEDRYQTAAGVEHDLRRCLTDWETLGRIDPFPLGGRDTPDRLRIPETLYGREREVAALLGAFDRVVAGGAPALVLVSGYSGVGKSSVVHELHRVLVPPRGLFAAGKFDQYQRDVPYGTLVQALRGLVRPLLGKREAELAPWRDALREALGTSGRLMADLVPELELVTEAILLVEDEWPVRSLARAALQRYGYSVVEADCAAAALDAWLERRGAVDLLVTDLVMPGGMTGLELADALRARAPGLKVLFMSGYSADAIGRVVQVASPDALLRKPFGAAELAERVRRVLDAVGTGSAPGE